MQDFLLLRSGVDKPAGSSGRAAGAHVYYTQNREVGNLSRTSSFCTVQFGTWHRRERFNFRAFDTLKSTAG
jgi:hypothetical protein